MTLHKYRISLVVPVYNESADMAACLQSALGQIEPFHEIIVVDNNSSDGSAAIARQFKGVKVVRERRQGVVFARSLGFDKAKGEIIARIDADTHLTPGWSRQLRSEFELDSTVAAVSGRPFYYDVALERFYASVENFFRRRMTQELRDCLFLQGANMAIRASSWHKINEHLCYLPNMHEDFDLAIHLQEYGHKVIYSEDLVAGLSARRIDSGFLSFMRYVGMSPHTYAVHEVANYRRMYPTIIMTTILWLPARILYRGYNPETDSFSLYKLFSPSKLQARVDPTKA